MGLLKTLDYQTHCYYYTKNKLTSGHNEHKNKQNKHNSKHGKHKIIKIHGSVPLKKHEFLGMPTMYLKKTL